MEENDEGRSGDGDDSSGRHGCVSIFMLICCVDCDRYVVGRCRWSCGCKSAGRQNIYFY